MKRASYSEVVVFLFALCLLLLTSSIAGVACCACHLPGTFFIVAHTQPTLCLNKIPPSIENEGFNSEFTSKM